MLPKNLTMHFTRNMSKIVIIETPKAPSPAAPYSQALKFNKLVFVSGQVPLTAENMLVEGSMTDKAEQVVQNVKNILEASNSDLKHVLKATVFLTDMKYFSEFNAVYNKYFGGDKPARTCAAVKSLPLNVDVEMEVIAAEKG